MYCNAVRLKELIAQAQADGRVSEELALMVARIAHGVWSRRMFYDRDDFIQESVVRFLINVNKVDVTRTPRELFNYITGGPFFTGFEMGKAKLRDERLLDRYGRHLEREEPRNGLRF